MKKSFHPKKGISVIIFFFSFLLIQPVISQNTGAAEQENPEQQKLKSPAMESLRQFLGSYTYIMESGEREATGTLSIRPMLDGSYMEWEFITTGQNSWNLKIFLTWDSEAQNYRIWRFDTRILWPQGKNEGTARFLNDEFVMNWSMPASKGAPGNLQNRVRMKGMDTLIINTEIELEARRQKAITTAQRISKTIPNQEIRNKTETAPGRVTTEELLSKPPPLPDHRIAYGVDSLNFGDLRIPKAEGPHPVVILIHGGCWLSIASLNQFDSLAEELAKMGLATWNISYRKIDEAGGSFPGTFNDVATGVDYLHEIAKEYDLDLNNVFLLGHSSGGHLATWAAARSKIPETSKLYISEPLLVRGVVSIAGPQDMEALIPLDEDACGRNVIESLMGGSPNAVPENYAFGSPSEMLPIGVRQLHLVGSDDPILPFSQDFVSKAKAAGDDIKIIVVPGAGHHDLIAPWSRFWSKVPGILNDFFELAK